MYPLKTKDQGLHVFKEFHASVGQTSRRKMKCLRIDNGGEYIVPFTAYCKSHGIRHGKVPLKTPHINGVAEMMNITIAKKVRSMLSQAKLLKSLWGETVRTVVDLINLSPSRRFNSEIPDEEWYGKKSFHGYLRVFECRAFVQVPKDERAMLDAKTKKCIYLGSPRYELGFILWDSATKRIVKVRMWYSMKIRQSKTFNLRSQRPLWYTIQGERFLK